MRIKLRLTRPWATILGLLYPRRAKLFAALSIVVTFMTVAFAFYFIINFALATLHAPANYFVGIQTTPWVNYLFIGIFASLVAMSHFFKSAAGAAFAVSLVLDLCFLLLVFYLAFFVPTYTIFWHSSSSSMLINATTPPP